MAQYTEKRCPKCGQQLRFPKHVGGITMACPSCGHTFHSDFKLGVAKKPGSQKSIVKRIFEMPDKVLQRILRYLSSRM